MSLYRDRAVVLRTHKLGEADRIVVFATEHRGKVRAVAKGVRRTSSRFGSRLEPLSHVRLLCWHGRGELDTVDQVEVIDHFRAVREDLEKMTAGLSLLEVVDQLIQEGHADPALYTMLVGALGALADPAIEATLVPPAFFLKALVLEGAGPVVEACAACGRVEPEVELVAFDLTEGGVLCRGCRRGRPMSPETLTLLRRILGGGLGAVLRSAPAAGSAELCQLATEAIEAHLDRRLRTVRAAPSL